jgi:hypothetical protein
MGVGTVASENAIAGYKICSYADSRCFLTNSQVARTSGFARCHHIGNGFFNSADEYHALELRNQEFRIAAFYV